MGSTAASTVVIQQVLVVIQLMWKVHHTKDQTLTSVRRYCEELGVDPYQTEIVQRTGAHTTKLQDGYLMLLG